MDEKINLLLIDDEEAVCIGVKDALKREAFNIDYRLSAEEGHEYLENHKIDIVLQDIKLGRGMNGIDSLKKIKSKYKDIEVIMLTGEDKLTTGVECMKNGAFDYMTKPFNKEHFLEKANDAAAKKKYNAITEKNKGAMLQAMANGVCHQFNNRLNEFVFEQADIAMMLDELMVGRSGGEGGDIDDKLGKLQKMAGQFGDNINKTKNIINSVSGYDNIISEKEQYGFMFIENIADIATGLLKLNNKLEVMPVKTVNIVDKTLYGIKSLILEAVYGCLQNAFEAIEDKRRYLDESEKAKYLPEIILSFRDTPRSHIIEIKDNGTGIKEENKNKIFAPFFTTKPSSAPGTGSGLFVMKKMIEEKHKGKLMIESEYGKGTTVTIEIPKETEMNTVLIIDDEKEITDIMAHVLKRKGFIAVTAETAEEGIQKYKEARPVCVLLDMKLKGPNDGDIVLQRLLEIDSKAYVYIMTGNAVMDEETAKQMGAKGYIHKPATAEEMVEKVKIAVKERAL